MIGIYKITSPTYKVYIGQSIDIEQRKEGQLCSIGRFVLGFLFLAGNFGIEQNNKQKLLQKLLLMWQFQLNKKCI